MGILKQSKPGAAPTSTRVDWPPLELPPSPESFGAKGMSDEQKQYFASWYENVKQGVNEQLSSLGSEIDKIKQQIADLKPTKS